MDQSDKRVRLPLILFTLLLARGQCPSGDLDNPISSIGRTKDKQFRLKGIEGNLRLFNVINTLTLIQFSDKVPRTGTEKILSLKLMIRDNLIKLNNVNKSTRIHHMKYGI